MGTYKLDESKIQKRLESDYQYATSLGHEVLGVFLQGSQNYGLSYEGSDIDTKAIIVPSFNDFVLNKKMVSTTEVLETNEHVDLKDVRLMWECFKKQNINFVEILFTKYSYINPIYKKYWDKMVANNEAIAHYNNYAAVNCISGMSMEKLAALCHPYESKIELINNYGYDPKQLHHIKRLNEFMKRYISGVPYKECLLSEEPEYTISLKRIPPIMGLEEAKENAQKWDSETKKIKNDYMDLNPVVINKDVAELLNECLLGIMKEGFKQYLINNP